MLAKVLWYASFSLANVLEDMWTMDRADVSVSIPTSQPQQSPVSAPGETTTEVLNSANSTYTLAEDFPLPHTMS